MAILVGRMSRALSSFLGWEFVVVGKVPYGCSFGFRPGYAEREFRQHQQAYEIWIMILIFG
jgi:hypothetical protein